MRKTTLILAAAMAITAAQAGAQQVTRAEFATITTNNGVSVAQFGTAPLNYSTGTTWQTCNETMTADAGGYYRQNKTLKYRVRVSSTAAIRYYPTNGVDTKYIEFGTPQIQVEGKWVRIPFSSKSVATSKVLAGNNTYYFEMASRPSGLKTSFTIPSEKFVYPVRYEYYLAELKLIDGKDGLMYLADGEDNVGTIRQPYISATATGPVGIPCDWKRDETYFYLTIQNYTGLEFPIMIDPSVEYSTQPTPGNDTYNVFDSSTNNNGSNTRLRMGNVTAASTYKRNVAMFKFDLTALAGSTINSATFYLYNDLANWYNRGTVRAHRVMPANTGWVAGTANGSPQAGSSSWAAKIAGSPDTKWAGDATRGGCSVIGTDFYSVALGTKAIGDTNWTGGEEVAMLFNTTEMTSMVTTNDGFIVYGSAGDSYFDSGSGDHGTAARRPKLVVTYTTAAGAAPPPPAVQIFGDFQ